MTLKQLREARAMSQSEVARELQVTVISISKWENAAVTPQPQYVRALAKLYEVSIAEVQDAIKETKQAKN